MKAHKLIAAGAALILACSCGVKESRVEDITAISEISDVAEITEKEQEIEPVTSPSKLLSCNYFDDGLFVTWNNRAEEYSSDKKVIAGVVPHHLTAGHLISGFFEAAAKSREDVETVVIIATSHNPGGNTFYTTFSDWDSPFGIVETDKEISSLFCSGLGAEEDDKRLTEDHSASSHIPFVKSFFPEAKTACLLVAPDYDKEIPKRLAETLYSIPHKDKCLFLFSIDFSHYLSAHEANKADKITSKAAAEKDYRTIEGFTNNNVDSPFCLSAYLRLSELFGGEVTEEANCNTADVVGIPYSEELYPDGVTSYFVFVTKSK